MVVRWFILLCGLTVWASSSFAEVTDPLNPFPDFLFEEADDKLDELKTADQLILDAAILLEQERVLDARTKLLRALKKDPKAYRAHLMLAGYYLVHVGHFRLALKYVKQAQRVFSEVHGDPPYGEEEDRMLHSQILYYLSQVRLNLDDYQGALDALDEFTRWKYYAAWYPGSRAWILMKLGRLEEAIRVARLGVLADAEPGRTLNMLGILLSMHGERKDSLEIFRQAISYELSLGTRGQPATPLNNSGEVYKEIFEEDKAESAWLKATSMPDGCEHVLPSLNLAMLYFDQVNPRGAKRAIDSFESCVAQFPLRNGEEHRALVHLARGRIDMQTGKIDTAIEHFHEALAARQWFGKIGTTELDLEAAAHLSLGQSYGFQNAHLATTLPISLKERGELFALRIAARARSWWHYRRARQVLAEQLKDFEDLYVRSTDSLLEYPTLGTLLSTFPRRLVLKKIEKTKERDDRLPASRYYALWQAEIEMTEGDAQRGREILDKTISSLRPKFDDLLLVHALSLILHELDPGSIEYGQIIERLYSLSRSAPRSYGLSLPVVLHSDIPEVSNLVAAGPFRIVNGAEQPFSITARYDNNQYVLSFSSNGLRGGNVKVSGADLVELVNKLSDSVFSEELG